MTLFDKLWRRTDQFKAIEKDIEDEKRRVMRNQQSCPAPAGFHEAMVAAQEGRVADALDFLRNPW